MQKMTILIALGGCCLLSACSSRDVHDTLVSTASGALRNECQQAGNCEVHCKSETTIKTPNGRCVGE